MSYPISDVINFSDIVIHVKGLGTGDKQLRGEALLLSHYSVLTVFVFIIRVKSSFLVHEFCTDFKIGKFQNSNF